MDIISCHLAFSTPYNRISDHASKSCDLTWVYGIAFSLYISFVDTSPCIGTNDTRSSLSCDQNLFSMNVDGVFTLFYLTDYQCFFCNIHGILSLVNFPIMSFDKGLIQRIPNDQIVSPWCKTLKPIEVEAIPCEYFVIIIYTGMIHEVAFLCLGIIIAFLTIGYVFFSSDGSRSKHIDMSCSMVIIQGKRVYHKVWIGDFHLCGELTFLRAHEVTPLLAGEYILFIEDFAIVKVISLLGIAVEE